MSLRSPLSELAPPAGLPGGWNLRQRTPGAGKHDACGVARAAQRPSAIGRRGGGVLR